MSYLPISNYYLFEYMFCRFFGKLEFQIKSDMTRVIKQIKHVIVGYFWVLGQIYKD